MRDLEEAGRLLCKGGGAIMMALVRRKLRRSELAAIIADVELALAALRRF